MRDPVPPFTLNDTIWTSLLRRGGCGAAAAGDEEGATPSACAAATGPGALGRALPRLAC